MFRDGVFNPQLLDATSLFKVGRVIGWSILTDGSPLLFMRLSNYIIQADGDSKGLLTLAGIEPGTTGTTARPTMAQTL